MTDCKDLSIREKSDLAQDLQFICKMRGSAQSILVRDHKDHLWILKIGSGLQGTNTLANEVLGSRLCGAIGLPVPEMAVFQVASPFFTDERTWLQTTWGSTRPAAGFYFASRYFPDSSGQDVVETLPSTLTATLDRSHCLGMFLFDVWALHADARQALFFRDGKQMFPIFIDHGHLFGGPNWFGTQCFIGTRFLQKCAIEDAEDQHSFDEWVSRMQDTLPSAFELAVTGVPSTWHTGDLTVLREVFTLRLKEIRSLAVNAICSTRKKIASASEQRQEDYSIPILSVRGTENWL